MEIDIKKGPVCPTENPAPSIVDPTTAIEEEDVQVQPTAHGLSHEEILDPNQIVVTVADDRAPVVVLFGPPACGKTMTLIRLSRYLNAQGYRVVPDRTFRPSEDENYKNMCDSFNSIVNSSEAASSTERMSFMLVKVCDSVGKTICQILEAPGEYYFSPNDPMADFPAYVHSIINGNNRKIWCFMVEPNWKNLQDRLNYVAKITRLKSQMMSRDKAVFLFNKVDVTSYVYAPGKVNLQEARRDVGNHYPGIYEPFRTKGIFGTSDNFQFIPFQTGSYSKYEGGMTFTPGNDAYPRLLWDSITKLVRG